VTHLLFVVPLGFAVLAAGVLPLEHVHHRADTIAPVIHSHFDSNHQGEESNRQSDSHHRSVYQTHHDSHETAVGLGQTVGLSQTVRSDCAPSLAPETVTLPGPGACLSAPDHRQPGGTPSPPLGEAIPRAPPA
jgi:hypothetical protein